MKRKPKGFIALISALVISTVLLLIATGGSLSGFYSRTNASYAEYKEATYAAAQACVSNTVLILSENSGYSGDATTSVRTNSKCYTSAITKSGIVPKVLYTFKTRSYISDVYTFLLIQSSAQTGMIVSENQVSTF